MLLYENLFEFYFKYKQNSILRKTEKLNNFGVLDINLRVPLGYIPLF